MSLFIAIENGPQRAYWPYFFPGWWMITQNDLKVAATIWLKNWAAHHPSPILDEKVRNAIIGTNSEET
jgi:hypothetical protein